MPLNILFGLLVQLVIEHMAVNHGVVGSSPTQTVPADVLSICQCFGYFCSFFSFLCRLGEKPL